MNKNIKILSIMVLLLFAGSYAAPFFSFENCDMPESTNTAMHCDMNMSDMSCCEAMTQCVTVPLFPLSSAQLNKVELQKELTVDLIVSQENIFSSSGINTINNVNVYFSYQDVHPGFQTPLLA